MILLSLAHAAPSFHAGVGLGVCGFPGLRGTIERRPPLARVELGVRLPAVTLYAVGQFSQFNAVGWEEASNGVEPGGSIPVPGDSRIAQVGAGVRREGSLGLLVLGVQLDAGLSVFGSPIDPEAMQQIVEPAAHVTSGTHSMGGFAEVGGDIGLWLVRDRASLRIGPEVGYLTNPAIGPMVGVEVGLAARF